ncbi:DsbA family protein [Candidatus Uhrbacteria bacterium]|nr:DsbA family protein [Candidatus Uhrbacteria bacterium]
MPDSSSEPRHPVRAAIGWLVFLALMAATIFIGWRVWFYYDKIRRGEIVHLPQFTERFTAAAPNGAGLPLVDRAAIETADDPSFGPADAKLTIVEFADFECPYSRASAPTVRSLMAKYGDRVRFIYRDFPLSTIHARAETAAVASECADAQGKFWAYHDRLYGSTALGYGDLVRYAAEAGLDKAAFEKCLAENRYKDEVVADLTQGIDAGVRGTPTFFLNGQILEGDVPRDVFEQLIEKLLQ